MPSKQSCVSVVLESGHACLIIRLHPWTVNVLWQLCYRHASLAVPQSTMNNLLVHYLATLKCTPCYKILVAATAYNASAAILYCMTSKCYIYRPIQ